MGKLLERVVSEQLTNYLDANDLFSKHQYGFRAKHNTSHPLIHFTKKVLDSLRKNFLHIAVFIDLKKAFDTVDHSILLEKLSYYGILGKELLWFFN